MKNNIYKSYAKKILKSEAFVSVIVVFVLALGIIGTSYALYMDVDTDIDYQLVEVGDLSIGFNNGDNTITLENMTPTSDDIATGKQDSDIAREIFTVANSNYKPVTQLSRVKMRCPDCRQEVSIDEHKCPYCGCDVQKYK